MDLYTYSYAVRSQQTIKNNEILSDPGDAGYGFEEDFSGDFAVAEDTYVGAPSGGADSGQVGAKIRQLETVLAQSDLSSEEKADIGQELDALRGRLNYSVSLSPQEQQLELESIYAALSQVEMRILAIPQGEAPVEGAEGSEGELNAEALEEQVDGLEDEIRELYSGGKITETLYDELVGKLGRIEGELDLGGTDLDAIDGLIAEMRSSLDGIRSQYIESGEAVDSVGEDSGDDEGSKMLESLRGATNGKTDEQILSALRSSGFAYDEVADLKAAINDGTFPPKSPGADQLENFVRFCDTLGLINNIKGVSWNSDQLSAALKEATPKIVTVLQAFYPDSNVSMTHPSATKDQWRLSNNITFDGFTFDWTVQRNGSQTEINVVGTVYNDAGDNEGDHAA